MRIEELIIDGFKSYAARTVISGWDSSFNAITGLNGSGKSNILDAICFVLGISSMSTVRASNLQDLIYKRGQAGVTKASVTIVFDNSDKTTSPIGFTDHTKISITRQIVLGGTSKYLINGHRAQQQTVLQLFQSVQLNINNPNFLIMQGKITKVLNMPPSQILALIAEAAGTKLFEDRREKAVKTMAKKDTKLNEIKALLLEEIDPKLERLRKEKKAFLEFQETQTELDKLSRTVNAHDYHNYSTRFEQYNSKLKQEKELITKLNEDVERLADELATLQEDLEKAKALKEKELRKGGKLQSLEKQEAELSNKIVRLGTSKSLKEQSFNEETGHLENSKTMLAKETEIYESKIELLSSWESSQIAAKEELQNFKNDITVKEELLASLQTGVSSKGKTGGYMGQLQETKQKLSNSNVTIEQLKLKIQRLQKEIKTDEPKVVRAQQEIVTYQKEIENLKIKYEDAQSQLKNVGFDSNRLKHLKDQQYSLQQRIYGASNELESVRRRITSLEFNYSKPSPNFDHTSIKGVAAKLFTLDKENFDSASALEVSAGGKLFNVVVDNEVTGSQLLEKGRLRKRVTIIPLNKIAARSINANVVQIAKDLCPGKVELALNLIGYENEVSKAMEYIFGSVFITKDPETSKNITFNPQIRARSVTLDGDVYDPSGTLSGGSRRQTGSILVSIQNYNKLNSDLQALQDEMNDIKADIEREEAISRETMALQKQVNLTNHALELAIKKSESSSASQLIKKHETNKEELQHLNDKIGEESELQKTYNEELLTIEKDMKEFEANKGSKLKELEMEIKNAKKQVKELEATANAKFGKYEDLQFEIEKLAGDVEALRDQVKEGETMISDLKIELEGIEQDLRESNEKSEELNAQIEGEKVAMLGINKEINELTKTMNQKDKSLNDKKLRSQKLSHELDKVENSTDALKKHLDKLIEENDWVTDKNIVDNIIQQSPNINVAECHQRINRLQSKFQGMRRSVNANIMSMIDNVEKKETSLKTMIKTIENDKAKIEETIVTLDEYKRETLVSTWQKVSKDFGQIFSDLLPGAFAKLVIPEGKDITEGLEVKVMLGKVWKESLVELSGGQRSLVALSLIMGLLQFKPAPMYILDEVDAALDLSHTQNIGHLIKTRFKGSQFIVVSLKEGMFTNANRVFRTRFQDGTSVVSIM
ncbi:condensin subunit [Saccharomycopsis crataegensis]|uniref:Condensin subunit n=1 Tax=Saccharomycopsis crataegensis TaxID=43959 RepID=A0AAV5QV99_9ASCO|nr:condensin subunit [Saccharomycopsis crataegensis]